MPEDYENLLPEGEAARLTQSEARPFSHEEMVTCEECLRANPPTRPNCLYCGAQLPVTETVARLRRPALRQPEKWEEGYNVILCGRARATEELLRDASSLLGLEREEARRILESEEALPLARLNSQAEARLLEERLKPMGLSAIVIKDSELMMKDENRRRVRAFDFTGEELAAYMAGSNEVLRAAWTEISLLVTGRLIVRRVELEERQRGGGSEMLEAREMTGDLLLLDLYTNNHEGAWRLTSDSFDFSCLGERKKLIAAQNFASLVEALRERAPNLVVDETYNGMRQALAPVWPPEERKESRGLRRERPGRFNTEAVTTTDNEAQFTRYSRLRHHLMLRRAASQDSE